MINFGVAYTFRNPAQWRIPFPVLYQEHLRQIVRAEELGYDTVWLTEHHFLDDGYSSALLPIAAAIAARTERIRIGTSVMLLPLHNPLRVAEDAATVDILSNGRLDLGLGQGYRVEEFEGFGISRAERGPRLEEGIGIIRRAFTERNFTHEGRFYQYRNVTVTPEPVQKPHPPLWIAARGPKAIARAGRLGYHFIGTGGMDQQQIYDESLRAAGHRVEDFSIGQVRAIYIAPTRDAAFDASEKYVHYVLNSYGEWMGKAQDLPGDTGLMSLPPAEQFRHLDTGRFFGEALIIGTPDDAIRMIEDYQRRTRVTHLCMLMQIPGMRIETSSRSLELFAKEVMPHLRRNG